ncbi:hypothetical protein HanIR_Chr16g0810221 [Helianthus annuus]|nr:hypothetical protein HanIR_Chr16g0810221 [Helianthus annuus]
MQAGEGALAVAGVRQRTSSLLSPMSERQTLKENIAALVRCSSATCGHFYHLKCVAKLLQKNDMTKRQTLKENIAAG